MKEPKIKLKKIERVVHFEVELEGDFITDEAVHIGAKRKFDCFVALTDGVLEDQPHSAVFLRKAESLHEISPAGEIDPPEHIAHLIPKGHKLSKIDHDKILLALEEAALKAVR